jgi:hypothetical protein
MIRALIRKKNRARHLSTLPFSNEFVNAQNAPVDFEISSAVVYGDFLSKDEGGSIIEDIKMRMKR